MTFMRASKTSMLVILTGVGSGVILSLLSVAVLTALRMVACAVRLAPILSHSGLG